MKTESTVESNLKNLLQREFIRRCKKNPSYSLRAYAQYLEIDQSFLSKLLNGRRGITPEMEEKFVAKLGNPSVRAAKYARRQKLEQDHFVDLKEDEYEIISTWYHFAILELVKTRGFQPDAAKVALKLGIHSQEVKDAVDRLARLGFLKVTEKKWVLVTKNHSWTQTAFTSEARRKVQLELVKKSMDALDQVPFTQRENGSLTVAVDSRRIPEFKAKMTQVLKDLSDCMQPDEKNLDSVYQVTISMFPLTKNI